MIDLRLGDWKKALADVETVDAIICDPPYGARTHDVKAFVKSWSPRCSGWFVAMTSHDLLPVYAAALEAAGRYVFAPLPFGYTPALFA